MRVRAAPDDEAGLGSRACRYELSDGSSNKFWDITLSGKSFTTTYGKIGSAGQTTIKKFATPAEAKKEHDKLVAEKVKKGYRLAGSTKAAAKPAKAAAKPAAKAAAKPAAKAAAKPAAKSAKAAKPAAKASKYVAAFVALVRSNDKRKKRDAKLAGWAAAEKRADLKAFFEAFADHDAEAATVGDFTLWDAVGDRVPSADDPKRDRDDVVCIGKTHGGDLFVVATPGTTTKSEITRIAHDEGWTETRSWSGLDSFLADLVTDHREQKQEESPDDESEWRTDLDEYL